MFKQNQVNISAKRAFKQNSNNNGGLTKTTLEQLSNYSNSQAHLKKAKKKSSEKQAETFNLVRKVKKQICQMCYSMCETNTLLTTNLLKMANQRPNQCGVKHRKPHKNGVIIFSDKP